MNVPELTMSGWKDAPPEVTRKMKELEEGGGGWVNQGPVQGYYLDTACVTEWVARCKSRAAFGCMRMIKLRYHYLTKKLELLVTSGRCHQHGGADPWASCKLTRGLPPQIQNLIKEVVTKHKRIKLRWEQIN